ncbi:MAG: class I SAM-dependent methyltransferase [Candidatus Riflebacteria bacterium]|nr:class I SAM-dependent methyltransferase [Candidatus Riflebacteria bacterium]
MGNLKDHYEKFAEEVLKPIFPWLVRDLMNRGGFSIKGKRVLDLGCGPGHISEALLRHDPELVVGLDISEDMLQRAAKRAKGAIMIEGDACSLPFIAETFDAVISRGSLFFWADLEAALKGVFKALKPGGIAFMGGGYGLSTPDSVIQEIERRFGLNQKKDIPKVSPEELKKLAQKISGTNGEADIASAKGRGFWLVWKKFK